MREKNEGERKREKREKKRESRAAKLRHDTTLRIGTEWDGWMGEVAVYVTLDSIDFDSIEMN